MTHNSRLLILFSLAVTALASGCAQTMALRKPGPLDRDLLRVGADRVQVIGAFGTPTTKEELGERRIEEVYKYVDGGTKNSWWSKTLRVILYTGGDVFTAFLDQIIWMPLELAFEPTEYAANVGFQRKDERWIVQRFEESVAKSGEHVREMGRWEVTDATPPPAAAVAAQTN